MKYTTPLLVLALFLIFGFIQNNNSDDPTTSSPIYFEVLPSRSAQLQPIAKEKVNKLSSFTELIPSYSEIWVTGYLSSTLVVSAEKTQMKSVSTSSLLTDEQKDLMAKAEFGAQIDLLIDYKSVNYITRNDEFTTMKLHYVVVPESQASFVGGNDSLKAFMNKHCFQFLSASNKFKGLVITFLVDESGQVNEVKLETSSGDKKADEIALRSVSSMPHWRPAQNSKGDKIKQQLHLVVGNPGGC